LYVDDARFGFIIIDTNTALFGILHGNTRDVTTKFAVSLPKKRNCGGTNAIRFARIRKEKRKNYACKISETALQCFITDEKVNVDGIILANVAELSAELHLADVFDPVSCSFPFIVIIDIEIYILSVFKRKFSNESSFAMVVRLVSIKRLN
jgi:peptide chain release factor subunit 1